MLTDPILIYGARKSGTTLLHNLIDGHPDILSIPGEVKLTFLLEASREEFDNRPLQLFLSEGLSYLDASFFRFDGTGSELLQKDGRSLKIGSLSAEEIESQLDTGEYLKMLADLVKEDVSRSMKDVFMENAYCLQSSLKPKTECSKWVFKEVGGNPEAELLFFRTMFPKGKIIFNLRDFFFTVRSGVIDKRRRGNALSNREIIEKCREVWRVNSCIYNLQRVKSFDIHYVSYENLVEDTRGEMEKIATFLDVPFTESLLEPTTVSLSKKVRTSTEETNRIFNKQKELKWTDGLTLQEKSVINRFRVQRKLGNL